jgi:hypothetical protein
MVSAGPPVALFWIAWLELTTKISPSPFFIAASSFSFEPGLVHESFNPFFSKIPLSRARYKGNLLMFQGG